jgi:hypothetical protein
MFNLCVISDWEMDIQYYPPIRVLVYKSVCYFKIFVTIAPTTDLVAENAVFRSFSLSQI